ncbi:CBS domain-containing protein [Verrucomicrobiota bacterium sgz303538]
MIAAFNRKGGATPVDEVTHKGVPVIRPNDPLDHAFQLMEESSSPVLPVVDGADRLQGLITPENVGELMLVQSAVAESPRRHSRLEARNSPCVGVLRAPIPAGR